MNDRIKGAFDQIHAEEALKQRTLAVVSSRIGQQARPSRVPRRLVPLAACLLLLVAGLTGYWAYFVPTAAISIDVNPSLELGINRFDKVISMEGYNEEGQALADSLDVLFLDYTQAIDQILSSTQVSTLLSADGVMAISVVSENEIQSGRLLANIERCTEGQSNTYCYSADPQEVEDAHALGLSCGKYQAYLEVLALDPTVTPEEIQGMTMREIQDLIDRLSGADQTGTGSQGAGTGQQAGGTGDNGTGNGAGSGYGNGSGHHGEGHHGYGHSGE